MDHLIVEDLVSGILQILAEQAIRIVLYGSVARGTDTPESDVDIAIFVRSKLDDKKDELLSDLIVDLNLKYNKVFSVIDIDEDRYLKWRSVTPFYQNVDREGIVLWAAA